MVVVGTRVLRRIEFWSSRIERLVKCTRHSAKLIAWVTPLRPLGTRQVRPSKTGYSVRDGSSSGQSGSAPPMEITRSASCSVRAS